MGSLLELLHTCLGVCGCFCLEEEFWQGRSSSSGRQERGRGTALRSASAGALVRPRLQAFRDMEELLLDPGEASDSARGAGPGPGSGGDGRGEGGEERDTPSGMSLSSSSEEMYRLGSFNTKVSVLRSQSPFYRSQQASLGPAAAGSSIGSGGSGGGGGGDGPAADIELKPAAANMLLGQQHFEARGRFVEAHPGMPTLSSSSAHPVSAVRRGASPQLGAAAG